MQIFRSRGPSLLVASGVCCLMLTPCFAWSADNAEAADVGVLIEQLQSESFAEREAAVRSLVEIGQPAQALLQQAVDSEDLEVRWRAKNILEKIDQSLFEGRLNRFAKGSEASSDAQLPGWKPFRERFGDSKEMRLLFVKMTRAEPALLKAYEHEAKTAAEIVQTRSQELQKLIGRGPIEEEELVGACAALMCVAGDVRIPVSQQADQMVFSMFYRPGLRELMSEGEMQPLVDSWIRKETKDQNSLHIRVHFCMHHELKAGLTPALKLIADESARPQHKHYAIMAVAKLGGKEHVAQLEPLLSNEAVCTTIRTPDRKQRKVQIRDVALFALVRISGQSPKAYGFPADSEHAEFPAAVRSVYLENDEKRTAALQKWQQVKDEAKE